METNQIPNFIINGLLFCIAPLVYTVFQMWKHIQKQNKIIEIQNKVIETFKL